MPRLFNEKILIFEKPDKSGFRMKIYVTLRNER